MNNTAKLASYYDHGQDQFLSDWIEWLRFDSISTDPGYDDRSRACADWTVKLLARMGLESRLLETSSKPVVYGHFQGKPGHKRIIYYGHYDVQPVDPLDLWQTPPFEPQLREGRLYARGASDNKGQSLYFLKALEGLIARGELGADVTVLLEGEEESGSEGLHAKLKDWRDLLQADVLMVCDTGALVEKVPFITMGLRGLIAIEVTLGGISHDLHSGALGGVVRNPATEMARLIASLHDESGRITIPGYYDEVTEFSSEDRALANAPWPHDDIFTKMVGVPALGGEQSFPPAERRGMRPTIEVNGIYSGYQGPGDKTIIPSIATCKLTSRLVSSQDPARCLRLLEEFLTTKAPKGLQLKVTAKRVGGKALALSSEEPLVAQARAVLDEVSGVKTQFTWEGGSIPIVADLAEISGATPLLVGFAVEQDKAHAPNESFALSQFKLGYLYASRMLQELSKP